MFVSFDTFVLQAHVYTRTAVYERDTRNCTSNSAPLKPASLQ